MGSKGSPAAPPAVTPIDNSNDMAMMMQIMQTMGSQASTMPAVPQITPSPDASKADNVDWTAKIRELTAEAANEYGEDTATRKGRSSTIRTPSLLDEETPTTTGNLL